jgi:tetratricopeptide (TPR) repeat protein
MSADLEKLLDLADDAHAHEDYLKEIVLLKDALNNAQNKINSATIHTKLGSAQYLLSKYQESKTNLFAALDIVGNLKGNETKGLLASINHMLGSVFYATEDYKSALKYYLDAHNCQEFMAPEEVFIMLTGIGDCYEKIENFNDAIKHYHQAVKIPEMQENDKAMIFEFIGRCYDKQEREHLAFENFGKAFEADPEYENGWYLFFRYAQLAYRFRQFNVSIEYLEKTVGQIPPDHENYIQHTRKLLGNNFLALEQHNKALSEFKEALKIDTNSHWKSHIYNGIAQSYFGLYKIGKTIKFALKALKEEYDKGVEERIYFLLAFCYGMGGIHCNTKKEKYYTEKLQEKFPNSAYLRELKYS